MPNGTHPGASHDLLYQAAIRRQMKTALSRLILFPPPAAGALWLAWGDGAGAGGTPDGQEALVVKHVVWNVLDTNQFCDLVPRPVEQRIEFQQLPFGVEQHEVQCLPVVGLIRPQSGQPRRGTLQRSVQRFHLTYLAAGVPGADRVIEPVDTVLMHQ